MQYTIAQDFYVQEFDIELYVGGVVSDGDLEPDVIAQLVSQGVLVSDQAATIEADEASPAIETDEQPVSSRRNRRSGS